MLYSYVPSAVKCRIFWVELVGLSKESIVTIERMSEVTTFRKAQDGSTTAFNDPHASYRVTINLEQVSPSNDFLHTVFKLHQRSGLNIKIPLEVSEENGSKFNSFDTFFETEPTSEFQSDSTSRQWVFICNYASYQIKGNPDSAFLTEALRATIRMIELAESAGIDLSNIEDLIDVGIQEAESRLKNLF